MLSFDSPTIYEQSKCFFSHGRIGHLEPKQLPTAWAKKGKPWSTILAQGYIRRVSTSSPLHFAGRKLSVRSDRSHPAARVMGAHPRETVGHGSPGLCEGDYEFVTGAAGRFLYRVYQNWYVEGVWAGVVKVVCVC